MNRFELLRYELDLTQQQVADGAGVSRGTVIRLEQMRNPKPTTSVANALAKFFKVSVAYLMGESETRAAA